jgi:hypothetical protein
VIIKTLSKRGNNPGRLLRYIFKESPQIAEALKQAEKITYAAGVHLQPEDSRYLYAEAVDNRLLKELDEIFGGDIKALVQQKTQSAERIEELPGFLLKHNIKENDLNAIAQKFSENENERIHKRSNAVTSYHTVISFSPREGKSLTKDKLAAIAKEFARLNGAAPAIAGVHMEKDRNFHIHFLASATVGGYADRKTKEAYAQIKEQLQAYQQKEFPELIASIVNHGAKKNKERAVAQKIKTRTIGRGKAIESIRTTLADAKSLSDFSDKLKASNHTIYYRNGKAQGVLSQEGIKYRFSSIGWDREALLQELAAREQIQAKLDDLQKLRSGKDRETLRQTRSTTSSNRLERFDALVQEGNKQAEPVAENEPQKEATEANKQTSAEKEEHEQDERNETQENEMSDDMER